jgi:hypothetical protein
VAAIRDGLLLRRSLRLEEADQDISNGLIGSGRAGFGHWQGEIPLTKAKCPQSRQGLSRQPFRRPCIGGCHGISTDKAMVDINADAVLVSVIVDAFLFDPASV